ncbi:porin [Microvirga sp. HBU67558]|uniref:porin n=1 Tax=Microvirga TaxID=186650 RepID=UPI001B383B59|nr:MULTISPECIES: porin [unclassified Microvirga]MBQ0822611.1 porin [Microvirga sp. HBU67558]
MDVFREIRTGSAACAVIIGGCVVPAGSQALDLPAKGATLVEAVRICSAHGTGFFTIPGTDTCLRIGARARGESRYLEPGTRADDSIGFRARGRIALDARTRTSYGLLRAKTQYEFTRNTGNYGSDTFRLDEAFIQFGGLTAGRWESFFDFYTNDYNFADLIVSEVKTNLFAYTVKLGSDLSATIALEDSIERRLFAAPNGPDFPGQEFSPAGARVPDLVGQLLWEPDWGKAQLSAALHQIRSANLVPGPAPAPFVDTDYGFAVQAGIEVDLPTIADGDELWLQAAYADGALSYLGLGNSSINDIILDQTDAFVDADGAVQRSKGWAATAVFLHYWTPQIRHVVFGSYGVVNYPEGSVVTTPAGGTVGFPDTSEWRIGTNLGWLPVSGLYLGVETLYRSVDPRGRVFAGNDPASGRLINSEDALEARLRVQRDF